MCRHWSLVTCQCSGQTRLQVNYRSILWNTKSLAPIWLLFPFQICWKRKLIKFTETVFCKTEQSWLSPYIFPALMFMNNWNTLIKQGKGCQERMRKIRPVCLPNFGRKKGLSLINSLRLIVCMAGLRRSIESDISPWQRIFIFHFTKAILEKFQGK